MESSDHPSGSIHFTLAGIPTTIYPSSWLVLLLLGCSGSQGYDVAKELMPVLSFIAAGMLCLLVHEYGHALSCRALGGRASEIIIASIGGATRIGQAPRTRVGRLLMSLAGPCASILLGVLGGLIFGWQVGDLQAGVMFAIVEPFAGIAPALRQYVGDSYIPIVQALQSGSMSMSLFMLYGSLFFVSMWWSAINLLPILPLDGAQALCQITRNRRFVCLVGFGLAALLCLLCLVRLNIFNAIICAYLTHINLQQLRNTER